MTTTISVANDGTKTYTLNVPMPAGKSRNVATAKYPFNEMVVGASLPADPTAVLTEDEVKAIIQAFNGKSAQYEAARKVGRLSYRRMPGTDGFRVWMVPLKDAK